MGKQRRNVKEVKRDILTYLKEIDFPATTGQVAKAVGLNWYSAKTHLTELKSEGLVFHKRVGRQSQWWTENVDTSRILLSVWDLVDKDTKTVVECLLLGEKSSRELKEKTGLNPNTLFQILKKLERSNAIIKVRDRYKLSMI